jgi:hypothetical protein
MRGHEMVARAINSGMIILVMLHDGTEIEGAVASIRSGNNEADGPITSYHGEVIIRKLNNELATINFMDVSVARSVANDDKLKEYDRAGVLRLL